LRAPVQVAVAGEWNHTNVPVQGLLASAPMKRTDTTVRDYVTREEMDAVLADVDRTHWCRRRDYALLLTRYNAGARVSEIACLHQQHGRFGPTCYVQMHGKGRKERSIPRCAPDVD
jgi:integrase/recombinase XerD